MAAGGALVAVLSQGADAHACGGCFHPATESQSTVVTAHRMAFALSTVQSVLWDQIKYAGSPKDFAWVLPVKGNAVLELSTDAWFETLDAATTAQVNSPPVSCGSAPSSGCNLACFGSASAIDRAGGTGSSGGGTPPVTITHEGTVGPYETVTLHANVPNALPSWLASHGYAVPADVAPVVDAYTSEGFDFIALRLLPGAGVELMKPVRVVTAGLSAALPLRMVAAGTGASVAITLFVIGEGRWEAQNFPNGVVDPNALTWDFTSQSSNYATARLALLAQAAGRTWNTAFAEHGALLAASGTAFIQVGGQQVGSLADAYAAQGVANGETTPAAAAACTATFDGLNTSTAEVVACATGALGTGGAGGGASGSDAGSDAGSGAGGSGTGGGDAGAGTGGGSSSLPSCVGLTEMQLPASQFACGPLDDIATALVGLHPSDVWLTRLEANLPRAALSADLQLQASATQAQVSNIMNLTQSTGDGCAPAAAGPMAAAARRAALRSRIALVAVALAALAAAIARRAARRRFGDSPALA
jgi:hypothetical protein